MKPIDLLLILAAVSLVVGGFLVAPAVGCAAISVACGAVWWLLGEADA